MFQGEKNHRTAAQEEKTARQQRFLIQFLYTGIWLGLAVLAVRYLLRWMLPFVVAFFTAALLQRPLKWLVRTTRVSKKVYSVMLVVLLVLLVAAVVGFAGSRLVLGAAGFLAEEANIRLIESTVRRISGAMQALIHQVSLFLSEEAMSTVGGLVRRLADDWLKQVPGVFAAAARWLTAHLPSLLISFFIWVVASIFFSIDYEAMTGFLGRQIPSRHRPLVRDVRELCGTTLLQVLRAYLLLLLFTFAGLGLGLWLLGIPYALPLAALIALLDILPVLGVGTVLLPWALLVLVLGDVPLFSGLVLLYAVLALARHILEPRLVSQQLGLPPLATLFFMLLGLRATGHLAGMLALPLVVVILQQLQKRGTLHLWKEDKNNDR